MLLCRHAAPAIEGLLRGKPNSGLIGWRSNMSHVSAIPPGGKLGAPRRGWDSPVNRASDLDSPRLGETFHVDSDAAPDPYADDPKWAPWKVTLAVAIFCGSFWAGISYLATRLMG